MLERDAVVGQVWRAAAPPRAQVPVDRLGRQAPRVDCVADALTGERADHARRVADEHHPRLDARGGVEVEAQRRPFPIGAGSRAGEARILPEEAEETLEELAYVCAVRALEQADA